ncbi:MAG TPA: ABC transporter ATP-binding protein, partial [Micromonosporaceae bacterium]
MSVPPATEVPEPKALSAMWRLCRLGLRHEPRLMVIAFALALVAAIPDALFALWLKVLSDGVTGGDHTQIYVALAGLGISAAATWYLSVLSTRVQRRFRDRISIALESHVARLQASVATITHHERPDYLDRLAVLRT